MDVNNNKNLSLLDYLNFDFSSSGSNNKTNNSFEDFYSKSTKSYSEDSKNNLPQDDKLKNKIQDAKNNFDKTSNYDKIGDKSNSVVDSRDKINNASNQSVESKSNEKVSNTTETKATKKIVKENLSEEELDQMSRLAQVLGVSLDNFIETMNGLNLDVESLADGENVKDLLVALNDFSSKAGLLTLDNLKDIMGKVQDIASEELSEEDVNKIIKSANLLNDNEVSENIEIDSSDEQVVDPQNTNGANQDTNSDSDNLLSSNEDEKEIEVTEKNTTDYTNFSQANNDVSVVGGVVNNANVNNVNVELNADLNMGIQADMKLNQTESFVSKVAGEMARSNVDTESVVKQLTESMKVEVKGDVTNEIRIALRPAHLGDVTLKIVNDNGVITAQFEAQSQKVKEIIESNFNQLKQSLEEQGVNVASLEVNVRSEGQENQSMNFGEQNNGSGQNANGSTLEIGEEIVQETIIEESIALGSSNSFKA